MNISLSRLRLRKWSHETSSAVPSRISLLILHTQAESGAYSRDSSRFPRRRLFIKLPTAIWSVPSLSGHAIAYQWRSTPRVRRHRAGSLQGSSSNGCCLCRSHDGPADVRLSFPIPTTVALHENRYQVYNNSTVTPLGSQNIYQYDRTSTELRQNPLA